MLTKKNSVNLNLKIKNNFSCFKYISRLNFPPFQKLDFFLFRKTNHLSHTQTKRALLAVSVVDNLRSHCFLRRAKA